MSKIDIKLTNKIGGNMIYIIVIKDDNGNVIARGKGRSLNDAVDNLNNSFEEYTIDSAIRILEEELKDKGE